MEKMHCFQRFQHLHIFCSIYLISDLQKLAFKKVKACYSDLGAPDSIGRQLAVIAALRVSFRKLVPETYFASDSQNGLTNLDQ